MTAKGKVNASTVKPGDRILVDTAVKQYDGTTEVGPSRTKTGATTTVAQVTGKGKMAGRRGYVIETTAGDFYAEPIQTMWLAPEDAAGVKRAHAEALVEHAERLAAEAVAKTNELGKDLGDAWSAEQIGTEDFDRIQGMHQAAVDAGKAGATHRALAWVREARAALEAAKGAPKDDAVIMLQPSERTDHVTDDGQEFTQLPYPFYVRKDGKIDRQDFWAGQPMAVIGFQRRLDVQKIDLWWHDAWARPHLAQGMYLVTVDRKDTWSTHLTAIKEVRVLEGKPVS